MRALVAFNACDHEAEYGSCWCTFLCSVATAETAACSAIKQLAIAAADRAAEEHDCSMCMWAV
jgi:hypothetical protein